MVWQSDPALVISMRIKRSWVPLSAGGVAAVVLLVLGGANQRVSRAAQVRLSDLPPVAQNQRCEECHAEIAREWRGSGHQLAFSRREFQHALLREPRSAQAFCTDCHAPESVRERQGSAPGGETMVSAAAGELGVACTGCHTERAPGTAAESRSSGLGRTAPHAFMGTDGEAGCGRCHEFEFQGKRSHFPMQRTLSEHRAASSDSTCASCHMQRSSGSKHFSHRFAGGRDARYVASALKISATRPTPRLVRIELAPQNVTHAVPTGDLFRRLNVSVKLADGSELHRFLARHFEDTPQGRREAKDDRVHLVPRIVEFPLPPGTQAAKVTWRVTYERVAHLDPQREDEATLDGWSLIESGEL